jgi:hypothetical protein
LDPLGKSVPQVKLESRVLLVIMVPKVKLVLKAPRGPMVSQALKVLKAPTDLLDPKEQQVRLVKLELPVRPE